MRYSIKLMQPSSLRGHVKSHVNKFPKRKIKLEEFDSLYSRARSFNTTYPNKQKVIRNTLKITNAILFLGNVAN